MRFKYKFLILSLLLFIVTMVLAKTYRPYVYNNNIFDYHFADTITSLFCVPTASLFFFGISSKYSFNKYILISTLSFILWEFISINRFIDYYDIIAVLLGAFITYIVGKFVNR